MSVNPNCGHDPQLPGLLRVLRIGPGSQSIVRVLSPVGQRVMGLDTHYSGKRSFLCNARCSERPNHPPVQWKGYLAVDAWCHYCQAYWCGVLEVTESCELDMRGLVKRGGVWLLGRDRSEKGKGSPVRATLTESLDPLHVPPAFELEGVLQCLYHERSIVLDKPNPLPDRMRLSCNTGARPTIAVEPPTPEPATAEEIAELRKRFQKDGATHTLNGKGKISGVRYY